MEWPQTNSVVCGHGVSEPVLFVTALYLVYMFAQWMRHAVLLLTEMSRDNLTSGQSEVGQESSSFMRDDMGVVGRSFV